MAHSPQQRHVVVSSALAICFTILIGVTVASNPLPGHGQTGILDKVRQMFTGPEPTKPATSPAPNVPSTQPSAPTASAIPQPVQKGSAPAVTQVSASAHSALSSDMAPSTLKAQTGRPRTSSSSASSTSSLASSASSVRQKGHGAAPSSSSVSSTSASSSAVPASSASSSPPSEQFNGSTDPVIDTAFDHVPNCAIQPTLWSVASGNWSNPATWSAGRVPRDGDIVSVDGPTTVTYDLAASPRIACLVVQDQGKLHFSTAASTRLLVETAIVLPGGEWTVGTQAAPVASNVRAEIVLADGVIDTARDPRQYTHGLLGFGTVTMVGAAETPSFLVLAAEPRAGGTTLQLGITVAGWRPGDTLLLPDSTFRSAGDLRASFPYTQIETATIQSINGATVTLAAPLSFDHLGARDPAGTLRFLPHVANISRNVVVRSENPAGTRGHTFFTDRAAVNIRYVQFADLGRTTNDTIDSTTFNPDGTVSHIGTNQIGRYALHVHHLRGPVNPANAGYQFQLVGNAVVHSRKWAVTVHESHYGLIRQNVIDGVQGTGIATEDGTESYNEFLNNFVVGATGLTDAIGDPNQHDTNGSLGNCYWWQGSHNTFRANVCADARRDGFSSYAPNKLTGSVPLFRGADPLSATESQQLELNTMVPLEEDGTVVYGAYIGIAGWYHGSDFAVTNTTVWYPGRAALEFHYTDQHPHVSGFTALGRSNDKERSSFGMDDNAYSSLLVEAPCEIRGFQQGIHLNPLQQASIAGCSLQNEQNIQVAYQNGDAIPAIGTAQDFRHVLFSALPSSPLQNISMFFQPSGIWTGKTSVNVYDYNGQAGNSFRVSFAEQAPDVVIPDGKGCPGGSMTNQQCWDRYGVATAGSLSVCADATTHPEITGGYTCTRTGVDIPPVVTLAVNAATVDVEHNVVLTATVSDDGLPLPPGQTSVTWRQISGPAGGQATFGDPLPGPPLTHTFTGKAVFSAPGTYVLGAAASDGLLQTASNTVTVVVTGSLPGSSASSSSAANLPPLTIGNVRVASVTSSTATVTWTTNNPSSSMVAWGLTQDTYTDSSDVNVNPVLSHTATLAGLQPGTVYHAIVRSIDAGGHIAESDDFTVTTPQ